MGAKKSAVRKNRGRKVRPVSRWIDGGELKAELRKASEAEAWRLGGQYTAVKKYSGEKGSRETETLRRAFAAPQILEELKADLIEAGLSPEVSSWAGIWRQFGVFPAKGNTPFAEMMRVADTCGWKPHAWIEQRIPAGVYPGPWSEWDLRSAYAWASLQGLPDPRSFQAWDGKTISDTGVYLVAGVEAVSSSTILPTWLRPDVKRPRWRMMDGKIVETYGPEVQTSWWVPGDIMTRLGLTPTKVLAGWEWTLSLDLRQVFDDIRELLPRWWKYVYRSHWGDWNGQGRIVREKWVRGKLVSFSTMPAGLRCAPWAWLTQARVSARLSELAGRSARIFVDSITVPGGFKPADRGGEVGQWKYAGHFPTLHLFQLPWRPARA